MASKRIMAVVAAEIIKVTAMAITIATTRTEAEITEKVLAEIQEEV